MKINVPNALTFFRIILIPCFVGIYYFPHTLINQSLMNWIGAGIFLFAAITDWLDGFFARYLNQASKFGAFFDPVADKLMVQARRSYLSFRHTGFGALAPDATIARRSTGPQHGRFCQWLQRFTLGHVG